MMTIWKWPVTITDDGSFTVDVPEGTRFIHVAQQRGEGVNVWGVVDPDKPIRARRLHVYGTGHPIDGVPGEYLGTFMIHGGVLVFHVFAEEENDG